MASRSLVSHARRALARSAPAARPGPSSRCRFLLEAQQATRPPDATADLFLRVLPVLGRHASSSAASEAAALPRPSSSGQLEAQQSALLTGRSPTAGPNIRSIYWQLEDVDLPTAWKPAQPSQRLLALVQAHLLSPSRCRSRTAAGQSAAIGRRPPFAPCSSRAPKAGESLGGVLSQTRGGPVDSSLLVQAGLRPRSLAPSSPAQSLSAPVSRCRQAAPNSKAKLNKTLRVTVKRLASGCVLSRGLTLPRAATASGGGVGSSSRWAIGTC